MKKRQQEEGFSKKAKINASEEAEEDTQQQRVPPLQEENSTNQIPAHAFSIITSVFSSFIRLLGPSISRRRSNRDTEERVQEAGNIQMQQEVLQEAPQEPAWETEQQEESPRMTSSALAETLSQAGEREREDSQESNSEEIRRGLISLVHSMFSNLIRYRDNESQTETETERDNEDPRRSYISQDFELLFQQIPFVHRQDPNSIIFTIVYYIGEEPSQRKTIAEEDLNKKSPEEVVTETSKECSVCLQAIEKGEKIRTLPCTHFFHSACVSEWLIKYADECPMCRESVISHVDTPEKK